MNILSWEKKYNLLKEYLSKHNGRFPSAKEVYKNVNLGSWVHNQRSAYKRKKLSQEKIEKLNLINFKWMHSGRKIKSTEWEKKYNLLKEYLDIYNKFPNQTEYYKGVAIGSWVNTQRTVYNNGTMEEDGSIVHHSNVLTKDRLERLNKINFRWGNEFEFNWQKNYELLKEYLKEHSGKLPSAKETYKDVNIGFWMTTQRRTYNNGEKLEDGSIRHENRILTKKQIEKLDTINFKWKLDIHEVHDKNWEEKYILLIEYLDSHDGNYPRSASQDLEEKQLGKWVTTQRVTYNNGKKEEDDSIRYKNCILTRKQTEKLNAINFKWYSYKHSDYVMSIKNMKKQELIRKKLLYKLKKVLSESKNEIETKEDIEKINEEFEKVLTLFD